MKILLSAFSCEPERGSEPEVGWSWVKGLLKRGHDVWLITSGHHHKAGIEEYFRQKGRPYNLHVFYCNPVTNAIFKHRHLYYHLYYFLWQIKAYFRAKKIYKEIDIDIVHHVTYVQFRFPSFIGLLGLKFILGPVAGGERAPFRLRRDYLFVSHCKDILRDLSSMIIKYLPINNATFEKAYKIYVASEDTKRYLPARFHEKVLIELAIGIDGGLVNKISRTYPKNEFNYIFVGQFISLKGMDIGIKAFAKAYHGNSSMRLTIVGQGPCFSKWKLLCEQLGIAKVVTWFQWVGKSELKNLYETHDALLFPSLHDSGGMVVLEAMSHGLPVCCLDLGGPSIIVNKSCGRVVYVKKKSYGKVVDDLSKGMGELSDNKGLYELLSRGALDRVESFTWDKKVKRVYEKLELEYDREKIGQAHL